MNPGVYENSLPRSLGVSSLAGPSLSRVQDTVSASCLLVMLKWQLTGENPYPTMSFSKHSIHHCGPGLGQGWGDKIHTSHSATGYHSRCTLPSQVSDGRAADTFPKDYAPTLSRHTSPGRAREVSRETESGTKEYACLLLRI